LRKPFRYLLVFLFAIVSFSLAAIDWQSWRYGDIRVTAAPKDTSYATLVVKRLHQRINAFQMQLGVYPTKQLDVKIIPSRQEYRRITLGKGKLVESSEAFYSPREGVIYVRSPEQVNFVIYDDLLMHEYIHWFLDETLDNVPLWFHEGMAMYYSGQFGFETYYNFSRYRFMGYKLSLGTMTYNYPSDRSYWNMFYLTSVFAVNNMASKYHSQWLEFWDRVGYHYNRTGLGGDFKSDFTKTFNAAYQMSLFAFSRDFDKTIKRYGWQFPLIGINALILSLLPFVVLAGWYRSRRKLKAMPDNDTIPEDEQPDEADDETPIPDSEPQDKQDTQQNNI
jgi:hypothetical protein